MQQRIHNSLMDNDFYKITMANVINQHYPSSTAEYEFICRGTENLGFLSKDLQEQIEMLSELAFTEDELEFLKKFKFLNSQYVDSLKNFHLDPNQVKIKTENNKLYIKIQGLWQTAIFWEIFILSAVNELYFKNKIEQSDKDLSQYYVIGMKRLEEKISILQKYTGIKIADFGTRRRFSGDWQTIVVRYLKDNLKEQFIGSSNCNLARIFNVKPIGTMAHEYVSAHLSLTEKIENAQPRALYTWIQTYKNDLGIALSDTFTSKVFFRDFDAFLANLFSGVRHDSGDPFEFAKKTIEHYEKYNIDPLTKTIVFSDSLDVNKIVNLWNKFAGSIRMSFGIGTNLTNDLSLDPLNIVIKMTKCNEKNVCKISDNNGKIIGDSKIVEQVMKMVDQK